MDERFERLTMILGPEKYQRLKQARVAVFGLGGVGGYVAEALVRCGIGTLVLADYDEVELTNFNRQLIATAAELGTKKTQAFKKRIAAINPDCRVSLVEEFVEAVLLQDWDFSAYDYIVDAIDTVSAKLAIIAKAKQAGVRVISAMGFGNKFDPGKIVITDIEKTAVCPLARVLRQQLRKQGIRKVTVAYSPEQPTIINRRGQDRIVGSYQPVVATAGTLIADRVIKDLMRDGQ